MAPILEIEVCVASLRLVCISRRMILSIVNSVSCMQLFGMEPDGGPSGA